MYLISFNIVSCQLSNHHHLQLLLPSKSQRRFSVTVLKSQKITIIILPILQMQLLAQVQIIAQVDGILIKIQQLKADMPKPY